MDKGTIVAGGPSNRQSTVPEVSLTENNNLLLNMFIIKSEYIWNHKNLFLTLPSTAGPYLARASASGDRDHRTFSLRSLSLEGRICAHSKTGSVV